MKKKEEEGWKKFSMYNKPLNKRNESGIYIYIYIYYIYVQGYNIFLYLLLVMNSILDFRLLLCVLPFGGDGGKIF